MIFQQKVELFVSVLISSKSMSVTSSNDTQAWNWTWPWFKHLRTFLIQNVESLQNLRPYQTFYEKNSILPQSTLNI